MGYQRNYPGNDDYDIGTDDRGRYQGRSSAREYRAAGSLRDDDRDSGYRGDDGDGYRRGGQGYTPGGYGQGGYAQGRYGAGQRDRGGYGQSYGPYGERPDREERYGGARYAQARYGQGRYESRRDPSLDYDYDERGFMARAGDEMRSWFGDDEAERRRALDHRYDEQNMSAGDADYYGWRRRQIESLDRDYHDFRRERQSQFNQQFDTWRTGRERQRQMLRQVREHMDVVGSDGEHVGTVDKVRGDRIILTRSDTDAGGHHHSVPIGWIQSVDTNVTLVKTADEAHSQWRDEENQSAFGGSGNGTSGDTTGGLSDSSANSGSGWGMNPAPGKGRRGY